MRYFIDSEFIDDGSTIALISIGMVAEDGRELYAENLDADLSKASEWVSENVVAKLWSRQPYPDHREFNRLSLNGLVGGLITHKGIAHEVLHFCDPQTHGIPEFWGYYSAYDWVAFCQLFGTMMHLPPGYPFYCRDLKQWADDLGNPTLPEQTGEHHALADAQWNKQVWQCLRDEADRLLDEDKTGK